jgi:hypothetical protein
MPTQNADLNPPDDASLAGFSRDMTPPERRTCFMGWALDAMDFMIYPLVIGTIIAHFLHRVVPDAPARLGAGFRL